MILTIRERVVLRIVAEQNKNMRNNIDSAIPDGCSRTTAGRPGQGFLGMPDPALLDPPSCRVIFIKSHAIGEEPMRTTSDPKPNNLKVRLNDNTFSFLKRKSKDSGESMSDHIRGLLEKEMAEEINAKYR